MYKLPATLTTKEDVINAQALVAENPHLADAFKRIIQGFLTSAKSYTFDKYLNVNETPTGAYPDYLVIEADPTAETGTQASKRQQLKLTIDDSRIKAIGLTLAQAEKLSK